MRLTYDPDVDAAYLQLPDAIASGSAIQQVSFIETPNGESTVTLDFDAEGRLLGVEILFAAQALPPEVLAAAEPA